MIIERTGVKVRQASVSDAAALTDICRQSWRQAYTGIIPNRHLHQMLKRRDTAWWSRTCRARSGVSVLTIEGDVKGYATYGAARRRRTCGEIYELYLAPECQGIGLGLYLFEAAHHHLDQDGHHALWVWALSANTAAIDFYWSLGGRPKSRIREQFGNVILDKIGFEFA